MPEKSNLKIEDAVCGVLSGEALRNALALFSYLRENKMNPANTSKNGWKISSKGCVVCYIWFDSDTGALHINPFISEYEPNSLSDDLKEIVWSKKKQGTACETCHVISGDGYNCSYKLKTVFGKSFADACARSVTFINPDSDETECIKKLLAMRKNIIRNGKKLAASPTNYG